MELATYVGELISRSDALNVMRPEHESVFVARFANHPNVRRVGQHEARGTAHAMVIALEHPRNTVALAHPDDHYGDGSLDMAVRQGTRLGQLPVPEDAADPWMTVFEVVRAGKVRLYPGPGAFRIATAAEEPSLC